MSRLSVASSTTEDPGQVEARATLKKAWGGVPNLGEVLALSLPLTQATLAFDEALATGAFSGGIAEQLAVAIANENRCAYCLSAHTLSAEAQGVSKEDAAGARAGHASDPKVEAALTFAQQLVRERGHVSDEQLATVRAAGWSDSEVVELVGHAIATTLTNYLHHLSAVPVDFPVVEFDTSVELASA